jgi:hypothetical protein
MALMAHTFPRAVRPQRAFLGCHPDEMFMID